MIFYKSGFIENKLPGKLIFIQIILLFDLKKNIQIILNRSDLDLLKIQKYLVFKIFWNIFL